MGDGMGGETVRILILSNWSDRIADLNALTEPNKQRYAARHGYEFINHKCEYNEHNHVEWLRVLADAIEKNDIVMTMGCDVVFLNQSIKIEETAHDKRVILARDKSSWWPINNDIMIWPNGTPAKGLVDQLINDAEIWLRYPQLWQNHLWNLMQKEAVWGVQWTRLVEPRAMNSTFQPMSVRTDKETGKPVLTRFAGPGSYQLGDWILHALDMPLEYKLQVIRWALQFEGDGTWRPEMTGK